MLTEQTIATMASINDDRPTWPAGWDCPHNRSTRLLGDAREHGDVREHTMTIAPTRTQQRPWSTLRTNSQVQANSPFQINPQIGNRRIQIPNFVRASLGRSSLRSTLNPSMTVLPIRLSHPPAGSVISIELP